MLRFSRSVFSWPSSTRLRSPSSPRLRSFKYTCQGRTAIKGSRRKMVRVAFGLGLLSALAVMALCACGGSGQESEARPLPEDEKVLRPGQYRSEEFEPSFRFRVGEGWSSTPMEASDILHITRGGEAGLGFVVTHRVYKPSKSGTPNVVEAPKDLVGWFQSHPYLRTTDPKPAAVGGVEGLRFDVAVVEDLPEVYRGVCGTGCVDTVKVADGRALFQSRGETVRLIVLEDVKGDTVTVAIHGPATGFDEFAPEAQKVVDSVKWTGS